ncbi:MAG: ABC transporter permease [Lachnospiraceae bacterium]|nr:ABC transporter permease [Lachnospiraceae bacterium]
MRKNIVFYVTRQYMKKNRRRTFTMFAGIVCMVLLMTCVFVGKETGIGYLQEVASLKKGKWHVSMFDITKKQYEEVEALTWVKETALSKTLGCIDFAQSGNEERPYLNVKGYTSHCFDWMNITLLEGRLPEKPGEIVVSESARQDGARIAAGDVIEADFFTRSVTGTDAEVKETVFPFQQLILHYGETVEVPENFPYYEETESFRENKEYTGQQGTYEVVGFIETPSYEDSSAAAYTALTFLEADILSEDVFNLTLKMDLDKVSDGYFMDIVKIAAGSKFDTNDTLLAFSGNSSEMTLNRLVRYMTIFFVVLIMAASVLLIYNVFNMSFQERSRYLGMLCSVGATGRQKKSSIFYETFYLMLFALPIGLGLGIGVIYVAMTVFRPYIGALMNMEEFVEACPVTIKIVPENLVMVAAFSVLTAVISAWLPARKIGKIGPVECIRGNVEKKSRRYKMSRMLYRAKAAEGMLARNNLTRRSQKTRSVQRAAAVFLVLLIVTAFGSSAVSRVVTLKLKASDFTMKRENYDYVMYGNDDIIYEAVKKEIQADPGITQAVEWGDLMFVGEVPGSVYSAEYDTARRDIFNLYYHRELTDEEYEQEAPTDSYVVNFMMVDDETLARMAEKTGADKKKLLDRERPAALVLNEGMMSTDSISVWEREPERYRYYRIHAMTDLQAGDVIPVSIYSPKEEKKQVMPLEIAGLGSHEELKDYVEEVGANYLWLFVNEGVYAQIGKIIESETGRYGMSDRRLMIRTNGEPNQLIERVKKLQDGNNAGVLLSGNEARMEFGDAIQSIANVLLISFVLLTSVICLLNLFNSVQGWMTGSSREFAVLKSVGMSGGQLRKMLLYECVWIFARALLVAGVFSALLIYVIRFGFHTLFGNIVIWLPVGLVAGAVVLAGSVLVGITLRCCAKVQKEEILENIRREG